MSIEAMKQALEAIEDLRGYRPDIDSAIEALRAAIQQAEAQQPATPEPVGEPVARVELITAGGNAGLATRIAEIYNPLRERLRPGDLLYTHSVPSVPDGLQWFTVAEHGLPEVGEVVVGGLWYTDPWLKPERATSFMWGQCRVVDTKHRDFKDGKQWLTFGPAHNQITHWARFNPPAMLAAKEGGAA